MLKLEGVNTHYGASHILPLRNGTEIPSKPPLYHWLAFGASLALGTVSELATVFGGAGFAVTVAPLAMRPATVRRNPSFTWPFSFSKRCWFR